VVVAAAAAAVLVVAGGMAAAASGLVGGRETPGGSAVSPTVTREPDPPGTTPPTTAVSVPLVLTVDGPAGAGRVTADDAAGVECRVEECSFPLLVGTELTLRAVPRVAAARFRGWSGDCTGLDDVCRLEVAPGEPIAVTARFSLSAAPTRNPGNGGGGGNGNPRPTDTYPTTEPTEEPTNEPTTSPSPDPTETEPPLIP
jgi:hypothetical protein